MVTTVKDTVTVTTSLVIFLKDAHCLLQVPILIYKYLIFKKERKSEQAHIPHAPTYTLLESAAHNECQNAMD